MIKKRMSAKHSLMLIAHIFLLSIMFLLIFGAIGFKRDGPTVRNVVTVSTAQISVSGGEWQTVQLPCKVENLAPRTPVTMIAEITPNLDDEVYIKTVYSGAKIYFNDRFVFEFGKMKNYPAYMVEPATELHMIEAYGNGEPMQLRIDFISPVSRDHLMIHPPMVGTSKELMMERSRVLGFPLIFSIAQIVTGIALILIFVCIIFIDKKGILFLWLGLFSLISGCWTFGENNFSSILFRDSAFLYIISFIGLFTFIVPLLRFTRAIVDFENPKPLWYIELFFAFLAGFALLLQLAGLVSCAKSMYLFHALLPLALIAIAVLTLAEYIHHKNINARRYLLPIGMLALTAVLELFNYQLPFTYAFSSLFQLGTLFFLLVMGVTAGLAVKDSINLKNTQKELAFEQDLINIQLKEQQSRSQILSQHEQQLRQQRHDLRHHLNAIAELAKGENTELQNYLQSLIDNIPKPTASFCENRAVNAIIGHYDAICRQSNIQLDIHLAVAENNPHMNDSSLCIIFGNLLENAVEACNRMSPEDGPRFIKMNSSQRFDLLTVTMDNSFNGKISIEDGEFRSSKRNEFGIGLTSVRSVAQKAGGDAEFSAEGSVFKSSVYMRL